MSKFPDVVILQTVVPDYRVPVFEMLSRRLEGALEVWSGDQYFTPGIRDCGGGHSWHRRLRNWFSPGRGFSWQSGHWRRAAGAPLVIAELNPRIVSTWCLLALRRILGKPTLVWGHSHSHSRAARWPVVRALRFWMARLAVGVVAYTRTQGEVFRARLPGRQVFVASNGCLSRADCRVAPGGARRNVIYVGRLIAEKKVDLLVEGFLTALPRLPAGARLVIVGEGSPRRNLEQRAGEAGAGDRVLFTGHVSDVGELDRLYASAFCSVSPGYVGLSAIQSLALGVPVLVADDEPHSPEIEACIEDVTCRFFRSNDPDALAAGILEMFANADEWETRRPAMARRIAEGYTFETMVEGFSLAIEAVQPPGETSVPGPRKLAVVWAQFGPYHVARLAALDRLSPPHWKVIGIEMAGLTTTYEWMRPAATGFKHRCLFPDAIAEQVDPVAIYRAALATFREERIDAVCVPSYWPLSSLAILLAAKCHGAATIMMNDSYAGTAKADGVEGWFKRLLVRSFDSAFIAGRLSKEYFSAIGLGEDRIFTGYDAIDNEYFIRTSDRAREQADFVRRRIRLPERYFLNVGRMVTKKNLTTLVDAYARFLGGNEDGGHPRLVLVGSGELEETIRRHCVRRGLQVSDCRNLLYLIDDVPQGDVLFYGFRQVEELPVFYALAEAFILPSIEEEWGLVVNEAMASGLPVLVSSRAGCCPDLVEHGVNGFAFDPDSAEELAGFMKRIADDPSLREAMGARSRELIQSFSCENFARNCLRAAEAAVGQDGEGDW